MISLVTGVTVLLGIGFAAGFLFSRADHATTARIAAKATPSAPRDVCEFQFGKPCSRMPRAVGPAQADRLGSPRACSNGVFVDRLEGRWVVAKHSQVDPGVVVATFCAATTP
ncbi:hypothetical protein [Noviluteimonas dokdonensis]|nr:hypothetical protein [Lysobacter dokdonensis]